MFLKINDWELMRRKQGSIPLMFPGSIAPAITAKTITARRGKPIPVYNVCWGGSF